MNSAQDAVTTPCRSALVLGAGASGRAAASLLLREGVRVAVADRRPRGDMEEAAAAMAAMGAETFWGGALPDLGRFDLAVVSPGISCDAPWVRSARSAGLPVIAEIELGWSRCRCPLLAVTGSKGKSSMAKLCANALSMAGLRTALAGNYGPPLCDVAKDSAELDWIVAEISSFQLETVVEFRPRVGVLLNIQPDHLDRHGSMEAYARTKARLFDRMGPDGLGIVLDADRDRVQTLTLGRNVWQTFGLSRDADYRWIDGRVVRRSNVLRPGEDFRGTRFDNDVMGLTAAAAVAALTACDVPADWVPLAARVFEPLPHRMQEVASIDGIRFVDDSKATNLAAVRAALSMTPEPVRLIAGGQLKESDLESITDVLTSKVRGVYLIGQASEPMKKAWGGIVPCVVCGTLERAVGAAWKEAKRGECVLLSPGCASFDQFSGFEERGSAFASAVRALRSGEERT